MLVGPPYRFHGTMDGKERVYRWLEDHIHIDMNMQMRMYKVTCDESPLRVRSAQCTRHRHLPPLDSAPQLVRHHVPHATLFKSDFPLRHCPGRLLFLRLAIDQRSHSRPGLIQHPAFLAPSHSLLHHAPFSSRIRCNPTEPSIPRGGVHCLCPCGHYLSHSRTCRIWPLFKGRYSCQSGAYSFHANRVCTISLHCLMSRICLCSGRL
jgi:hypothetical protein